MDVAVFVLLLYRIDVYWLRIVGLVVYELNISKDIAE